MLNTLVERADRLVRQDDVRLLHPVVKMHEKVQRPRPRVHQRRRIPSGLGIAIVGVLPEGLDPAAYEL